MDDGRKDIKRIKFGAEIVKFGAHLKIIGDTRLDTWAWEQAMCESIWKIKEKVKSLHYGLAHGYALSHA